MITLQLAWKNITHAGLRTWLNVAVLSFAFVLIIWTQGIYDGMARQMLRDTQRQEIGSGQFRHRSYDPYDPFSLDDAHAELSLELQALVDAGQAIPSLISRAAIFPQGNIQTVLLRGIPKNQAVLELPSTNLQSSDETLIPVFIGKRMAQANGLQKGDIVTMRWKDVHGTFDARDIEIIDIFHSNVQAIDHQHIWLEQQQLETLLQMPGQATIVTLAREEESPRLANSIWPFFSAFDLTHEIRAFIKAKKVSSNIIYMMLMAMALLAIFDTQVLAIFRRRKEMGTMMALGMTRLQVITLFTAEGTLHGLLAILVGAIYGIPLLAITAHYGIGLPEATEQAGFSMGTRLFPVYGIPLFFGTALLLFLAVLTVSFMPTRRIAHLKPTDAIRGKWS